MRISDWSSDVCSSDLRARRASVRSIMTAVPDGFDIVDEASFSPERILQSREMLQILIAALYELPEMVRIVFSHYHFDGVAQVEIARRMGVSPSTVEKHMARANQIGHASCRARVCQYVVITGVAVTLKKKKKTQLT